MRVTEKDKKALQFISDFKVAHTSTIAELFYPCLHVGQERLKLLYDNKLLKRQRDNVTSQYYYYIKRKPKQLEHCLCLTNFYKEINKLVKIEYFDNEVTYFEEVRPDGFLAAELPNGKKEIYFIEIERSNKPNVEKYEKLFKTRKWQNVFPKFPTVIFITNKQVEKSKYFDVIKVDEELKNIKDMIK